jgi:hypothetical protein
MSALKHVHLTNLSAVSNDHRLGILRRVEAHILPIRVVVVLHLNTVVGIMGGLIAVLVLVVAAGGYWVYSQKNAARIEMEDDDDTYRENVRLDTAEDAEPMIIADRD